MVFSRGGRAVFTVPASVAFAQDDPTGLHAVRSTLRRTGAEWVLTLTPNRDWRQRALARGPVVIDPTVEIDPDSQDCTIEGDFPTTGLCSDTSLEVGYDPDAPAHDHRALVQFDVSSLPKDAVILNADLGLTLGWHATNTAKQVGLYPVLRTWTNSATWTKYDATNSWGSAGAAASSDAAIAADAVQIAGSASGFVDWYPIKLVQGWVDGSIDNHGVLIRDVTPEDVHRLILTGVGVHRRLVRPRARATRRLPNRRLTVRRRA
jgi:hypothetical protein